MKSTAEKSANICPKAIFPMHYSLIKIDCDDTAAAEEDYDENCGFLAPPKRVKMCETDHKGSHPFPKVNFF